MAEISNESPAMQMTIPKMTGDMRFVSIFYIIVGVLYSLSIIGAVIGIPLILSGLRLRESADSFSSFLFSNESAMLENALERQSSFFFIQKVMMIIILVGLVINIVVLLMFGIALLNYFQGVSTTHIA